MCVRSNVCISLRIRTLRTFSRARAAFATETDTRKKSAVLLPRADLLFGLSMPVPTAQPLNIRPVFRHSHCTASLSSHLATSRRSRRTTYTFPSLSRPRLLARGRPGPLHRITHTPTRNPATPSRSALRHSLLPSHTPDGPEIQFIRKRTTTRTCRYPFLRAPTN